jgi:hypothetical protein
VGASEDQDERDHQSATKPAYADMVEHDLTVGASSKFAFHPGDTPNTEERGAWLPA